MKERIKYQGIEFEMDAGDPPDIMRPCVNPETVNITPKIIEESLAKIYKRLDDLVIKIKERKLIG